MTDPAGDAAQDGPVLLIVDDEPDILESFKFLLQQTIPELHVIPAGSAHDALEVLGRQRVDLILSDFKMPVMDGLQFLIQAGKEFPDVPRIMFTAYADDQRLAQLARSEARVSEFLSKTLDPKAIVRAVKQHLPRPPRIVETDGDERRAEAPPRGLEPRKRTR